MSAAKACQILREYDRMPNNSDSPLLEKAVERQLRENGILRLLVFVCPRFKTGALFETTPENYMPATSGKGDLFEPRVLKIQRLREELMRAGVPTEINLVIGDNDAQVYIFPFLPELQVDPVVFSRRQRLYERGFDARAKRLLGRECVTWSLGDLEIGPDETEPTISEEEIARELRFFEWLFSAEGPYRGRLTFPDETLREMVKLKFQLYGNQGRFMEELGGILLQTEGPGVWLQRTKMLRCTGSKAVPAIYPWIRKEELVS